MINATGTDRKVCSLFKVRSCEQKKFYILYLYDIRITRFIIRSRDVTINKRLMKSTIYEDLFNAKFPTETFNVENS